MSKDSSFSESLVNLALTPMDDSDVPIKAFITNLGKYNEGELVGRWHAFPTSPEAIQETFREIDIDGIRYEEFFVTDYEVQISGLYDLLPEYVNLDELNYLAVQLQELVESHEIDKFEAVVEYGEHTGSIQDIINLTDNLDCFDFLPDIDDDSDLGYYWIEESGCYDLSAMGNLSNYIDHEKFGRDVRMDEGGSFVGGGYVRMTGDSFIEHYQGVDDIPDEHKVSPSPDKSTSMTVLYVEVDKAPREVILDTSLGSMQKLVGGYIQAIYPYDDPVALVCNEEGKLNGLPLNRALYDDEGKMSDIIAGNFFVCGLSEDNFTSLQSELMEKYREQFEAPEKFISLAGTIVAVKQPRKKPDLTEHSNLGKSKHTEPER